jgi:hypothetical protein
VSEITSGDLQILRGYRTDGGRRILAPRGYFLSVEEQEEVFAGQLSTDPLLDPQTMGIYSVGIDNTTGSHTNTREHMTVDFGTTPGATDLGQARLRGASATALNLSETAPGALPIADNDYFSVKRTWRPWLVLPRGVSSANGTPYTNQITMYVDYDIPYNDQNENFTPKANITRSATVPFAPKPAGFVDGFKTVSPQTYRTMVLSSAFSFCPDDTIASQTWDVQDGTITVGSDSDQTITVRFPVGFRWISLTVVSTTGGKSGVMYFPIWVHDENYMPLTRFHKVRDTTADWREVELEFFQQNTSEINIPKGAALCCWEFDPFWGEDIPDQYRDQFLGWNKDDVTLFRKNDPRNNISISGLAEWLNRYRAIPMRVYDPLGQASSWFEMENISNDKLAYYLLKNFSTAFQIGNLFLSGNNDRLKSLDLTGNSLFGQVQYAVQGYQGVARSDSLNAIWIRKRYPYMTVFERAAVDRVMALTQSDRTHNSPLRLSRRRWFAVASVLGSGGSFNGTTQTIYNSRAPGRTPLDSNSEQDAPGINLPTTDSQTVLNWLTGQHLAVLNNANDSVPYQVLPNLDCIEPAWEEPILLSDINPDTGLVISNKEFLVKEVNVTYENPYEGQGKRVEYTLTEVTLGAAGQMVEVIEDTTDPIDYEPPTDIYPIPVLPSPSYGEGLTADTESIVSWAFDLSGVGYAQMTGPSVNGSGFSANPPIWDVETLTHDGQFYDAVVDPWTYIDGTPNTTGWLLTRNRVYKTSISPSGVVTLTSQHLFNWDVNDTVVSHGIHTNIAKRNFVVVTTYITNASIPSRNGHWHHYTTDGVNWTGFHVSAEQPGGQVFGNLLAAPTSIAAQAVSARFAGRIYVVVHNATSQLTKLIRNDNYGVGAWTTVDSVSSVGSSNNIGTFVFIPYPNNQDEGVIWWGYTRGVAAQYHSKWRRYDHGVGTTMPDMDPGSNTLELAPLMLDIDTHPNDKSKLRLNARGVQDTGFDIRWKTDNEGGSGTLGDFTNLGGASTNYHNVAYVSPTTAYWWGQGNRIGISTDDSATIVDKRGALPLTRHIRRIWGLKE